MHPYPQDGIAFPPLSWLSPCPDIERIASFFFQPLSFGGVDVRVWVQERVLFVI